MEPAAPADTLIEDARARPAQPQPVGYTELQSMKLTDEESGVTLGRQETQNASNKMPAEKHKQGIPKEEA